MSNNEILTRNATGAFLGGTAVIQAVSGVHAGFCAHSEGCADARRVAAANGIGASVCFAASLLYGRMSGNEQEDTTLRHADWIITTPLMLVEFFLLLRIDIREHWASLLTSIVAIIASISLGHAARMSKTSTLKLFMFATVAFLVMMWVVLRLVPEWNAQVAMPLTFLGVWALYPAAFWSTDPATANNILDAISKGVFGVFTALKGFNIT